MIRSFIYLNEIVEDKDDILWFPSGLKREFSPHFARLLASLCDEGKGEVEQGGARGAAHSGRFGFKNEPNSIYRAFSVKSFNSKLLRNLPMHGKFTIFILTSFSNFG